MWRFNTKAKDDSDCAIPNSTELSPKKWKGIDHQSFIQSWDLLNVALETQSPVQIVSYEGLQQNVRQVMTHIAHWKILWPLDTMNSRTAKVSSEDLRVRTSNFQQVEDGL